MAIEQNLSRDNISETLKAEMLAVMSLSESRGGESDGTNSFRTVRSDARTLHDNFTARPYLACLTSAKFPLRHLFRDQGPNTALGSLAIHLVKLRAATRRSGLHPPPTVCRDGTAIWHGS